MERLTEKDLNGDYVVLKKCAKTQCVPNCDECEVDKEAMKKLKEYEDAEEQGMLIRLPFRIGETVFTVDGSTQGGYDVFDWDVFGINEDGLVLTSSYSTIHVSPDCIENNVFLTREEAEAALERMK